jgi:hypothetical protein
LGSIRSITDSPSAPTGVIAAAPIISDPVVGVLTAARPASAPLTLSLTVTFSTTP